MTPYCGRSRCQVQEGSPPLSPSLMALARKMEMKFGVLRAKGDKTRRDCHIHIYFSKITQKCELCQYVLL